MRVPEPVRAKPSAKKTYGEINCVMCKGRFVAKSASQKYCSRACQLDAIHLARINVEVKDRPCETCGKIFRSRPNNIGRFCSRQCNFEGQRGHKAPNWTGGKQITQEGYVRVQKSGHPAARGHGGYVAEHRLVMESILGRYLLPNENVHHRNGQKTDNSPENLELWIKSQPSGQRVGDMVKWAKEILRLYGELVLNDDV